MSIARFQVALKPLLPRIYGHPFNVGLQQGTLSKQTFHHFLQQDVLYLSDFSQSLRHLEKRFPITHQPHFARLAENALDERNSLLASFSKPTPLFFSSRLPEKNAAFQAYSHYLLQQTKEAPLEEGVAAMLPCYLIYNQLGKRMLAKSPKCNPYRHWINAYYHPDFSFSTQFMKNTVEAFADKASPTQQERMVAAFMQAIEYEIAVWDSVSEEKTREHVMRKIKNG